VFVHVIVVMGSAGDRSDVSGVYKQSRGEESPSSVWDCVSESLTHCSLTNNAQARYLLVNC